MVIFGDIFWEKKEHLNFYVYKLKFTRNIQVERFCDALSLSISESYSKMTL